MKETFMKELLKLQEDKNLLNELENQLKQADLEKKETLQNETYEQVIKTILNLSNLLNKASEVYYMKDNEIMSNYEYDKLYDELLWLEEKYNFVSENSPTKKVGYEVKSNLKKEKHEFNALSLDKTKDRNVLKDWLKDKTGSLGWKLDGLTIQLTYDKGNLSKAVTRGNGEIGENVTHNAKYFSGVPKKIPFKGHLVVRGEAMISYKQFEEINKRLEGNKQYKNPRNLASGSVRQLDAKLSANRHVEFKAFQLVFAEGNPYLIAKGENLHDTYDTRYRWLKNQGFDVVEYFIVDKDTILDTIKKMEEQVKLNEFPSDGLVLSYNDISYGESLGTTGKFPKHSIAFKWADELEETKLTGIEWSPSRTGLINPVALFEPVELEGTTVSRASIHNVSIMKQLKLGIGDIITVYKANMIIPQIAENKTKSNTEKIPKICPVCGGNTTIKESKNNGELVETLYCVNKNCPAKHIGKFVHFVERDRMNIPGLNEATLEKLIDHGFIKEYKDLYHLSDFKDQFMELEGQGEKSYDKLIKAIENSRNVKLENLIAALGIPNVGRDAGKKISKYLNGDIKKFHDKLESKSFLDIEDIGEISNKSLIDWYEEQLNLDKTGESEYFNLLKEITVVTPKKTNKSDSNNNEISGKTFVVTGTLEHFHNRKELIEKIESFGGKVTGTVTNKTSYLINNDVTSSSGKNKKAKELKIPIISEEEFIKLISK